MVAESRAAYCDGRSRGEATERFAGSRRWYRGRIVGALRALPPHTWAGLDEIGHQVKPDYSPADRPWLLELAQALARDGLIDVAHRVDGTVRLALPE